MYGLVRDKHHFIKNQINSEQLMSNTEIADKSALGMTGSDGSTQVDTLTSAFLGEIVISAALSTQKGAVTLQSKPF